MNRFLTLNLLSRTHRERKEAYTASLEGEVVQLRANEARLLQETKTLYSEVAFLKKLLVENDIAIPQRVQMAYGGEGGGGDLEGERRIALSVGQENKKKNRRKQIYVQHMPREPLRECTVNELQLHPLMMSLLMTPVQLARYSSLLRRRLAQQY